VSALLAVEPLTKYFGGLRALSDVTLGIEPGVVTAVIGPNGAGKSTFFNVATGYTKASGGRVMFRGRDVTNHSLHLLAKAGVSRTFQVPRVFGTLTVLENAMLGQHHVFGEQIPQALFRRHRMHQEEQLARERGQLSLEEVGLDSVAQHKAATLGYAQRKMLEIARALTADAELLLLDEPFSGIHDEVAARVIEIIKDLPGRGKAVCLIEHNMRIVMSLAEHIYVLDHGELIAQGSPDCVRGNEKVLEAYLGKGATDVCA
jgi:branched-chain amino acid transport system ATP-binding protein